MKFIKWFRPPDAGKLEYKKLFDKHETIVLANLDQLNAVVASLSESVNNVLGEMRIARDAWADREARGRNEGP